MFGFSFVFTMYVHNEKFEDNGLVFRKVCVRNVKFLTTAVNWKKNKKTSKFVKEM